MRLRPSRLILIGLFLAGAASGCLHTKPKPNEPVVATNTVDPDASKRLELPPLEGAKACLTTAQMLDKAGKTHEAILEYELARKKNPDYKHVCRRLAVLYDFQGNAAKSDEEFEKALALYPKDADLLNDAGYSNSSRGNYSLAEEFLRRAIEINPDHKRAWMNLGMTLFKRGRTEEAFEAFCRAVPEAYARFNLGVAFTMQGMRNEAIREYRRALELSPDLEKARMAIAQLENPNAGRPAPVQAPDAAAPVTTEQVRHPAPAGAGFAAERD